MGFCLNVAKTKMLTLKTKEEVLVKAAELKGYGGTECERQEKDARKRKIKSKILGGEMRPFTWAVGQVGDLTRRVDGQHSSEDFLELTPEEWAQVRFPVVVFWEHNDCDTLRDLAVLFEQYNPPWSSRNTEDLIGAHFGIHADLRPLEDRHVNARVTAGMAWYAEKAQGKPRSPGAQFQIVHDDGDAHAFLLWCGSFLQRKKTEEMFHPAVIGAMRHTYRADDPTTQSLWKQVALGKKNNEEGSPAYKLAVFLEMLADAEAEWPRAVSKNFTGKGKKPSEAQVFATCLRAYQGERSGKRLGDIFDDAKGKKVKEVAAEHTGGLPKVA